MDAEPKKRDAIETYNQAYQACGELWFTERVTPTVVAVCERIQKKHTAVVGRALKAWKEDVGFEDLLHQLREAIRRPAPPAEAPTEPDFGQAVVELYRKAKAQAVQELDAERKILEEERVRLNEAKAAAEAARDTLLKEWDAYRIGTEREAATLKGRIAQLEQALADEQEQQGRAVEQLRAERETLLSEVARRKGEGAGLAQMIAGLQEAHQRALTKMMEQFDQDHAWHLARIAEEKETVRAGLQEKLDRLATRLRALEPEAARANELRWEARRQQAEIARLRQANAELQRQLGKWAVALRRGRWGQRPVEPVAESEKIASRRVTPLRGSKRGDASEARPRGPGKPRFRRL